MCDKIKIQDLKYILLFYYRKDKNIEAKKKLYEKNMNSVKISF